jgi:hypothetical protein
VPGWPKLAWVATFTKGSGTIEVLHGPMVETAEDWCVEAVWAGDFAAGDFDRTDLVFGSGVRVRGDRVTFVSSGSTLDRLSYSHRDGAWCVSNSLPALLATAGLALRDDYHAYAEDLKSICGGLAGCIRTLPADAGDVNLVYFNNLMLEGGRITEVDKPDTAPRFETYEGYVGFLLATADQLAANMTDPQRKTPVAPLVTISSGYDSPATAVIARRAGCRQAVTMRQSTSLWRGTDTGAEIARNLGLSCRTYNRTARDYPMEASIWAVVGRPGVLNWTLFDYPEPLCLLFTGCHGDKVWARKHRDFPDPFVIPSVADMGIGIFRLFKGVMHCPVPFWGMRHWREIEQISFRDAMEPWTLHTNYDRPIPRRVVEEAGLPRGSFAVRKKNTSHEASFLWPYSREAQASFGRYLRARGVRVPPPRAIALLRRVALAGHLVTQNVTSGLGTNRGRTRWLRLEGERYLFHWANAEIRQRYADGLAEASRAPKQPTKGTATWRLHLRCLEGWPKLAWVASVAEGADTVEVLHGPMVETGPEWCVEAVWAGEFQDGDFDRTDLICGTGVRCRGDHVTFVSSGTALDRLWYCNRGGLLYVSNSLPALLATAGLRLREDYKEYASDIAGVDEPLGGLSKYTRHIPTGAGDVNILYFQNLLYDGRGLTVIDKADTAPHFRTFEIYEEFLADTARRLGSNLSSRARRHSIVPMATVSSGYDSLAAAIIARHAGCQQCVTISNSTSLWRGSDSGEESARQLGMQCRSYRHSPKAYRAEEWLWAATGRPRGLNFSVFDFPGPLCLLFTGNYGDKLWDRAHHDVAELSGDITGISLTEFRLFRGIFHCAPAWWGARHGLEVQALSFSEDMEPWTLHNSYDRPIPRRLVEEAGISRRAFGQTKKNTSSETDFLWPFCPRSRHSFEQYLRSCGIQTLPPPLVWLLRKASHWAGLVQSNLLRKYARNLDLRQRLRPQGSNLLFQWANSEVRAVYERGLQVPTMQQDVS